MDTGSLSWFKKAKKENALIEYKTQNEENTNLTNFNPDTLSKAFAPSYLYLKHMEKKGFGVFIKKEVLFSLELLAGAILLLLIMIGFMY